MKRNLIIFIVVWVFSFVVMSFNQASISLILSNSLDFLFSEINTNTLSIIFSEEGNNVKAVIHNKLSEVPYYWIRFDTQLHFIAPFAFLVGLLSSMRSKRKIFLSIISIAIFILFYSFKMYLMIKDHLLRETFLSNGEVISVMKNPNFNEITIKSLNEILNTKAPIYSRYFLTMISFLFPYIYYNYSKFKKIINR